VRLGAVFPTHDVGRDRYAVRDFAQGVEALGFDHLVVYDHVLGAVHDGRERPLSGPYDERDEFHEPLVLLGHLAAVTERIELVPGVVVAPQRQTALLAKQAAEVQILSGGRLRLGLGTGWNHVEYEALGSDFDHRGAVLDEQVGVLRRLWTEELPTVHGRHHTIDRASLAPRPEFPPPIWLGGYGVAALRRSASVGDGHLFGHLAAPIVAGARRLRELVAASGRTSPFGLEAIADVVADEERWVLDAMTWHEATGCHLTARTLRTAGVPDRGVRTVAEHLAALGRWIDVVGAEYAGAGVRSRPSPA
jgi:probable F420-dependent oxidoreductase